MAFQALVEEDLNSLVRSWAVRIWLGLMIAHMMIVVVSSAYEGTAADSLAGLLATFPLIWSIFVIINSAGAVSSEAGVVADSILSKAVTRYDYILAKLASRLLMVIGLYTTIALSGAYLISRYASGPLPRTGTAWGILLIGMTLVLLTTISVALSTLFNRTMVALVVAWALWYAASGITALFKVSYLSPIHIADRLPVILLGQYDAVHPWRILIGFTALSAVVVAGAVIHFAHKDL
jgi:hypothetical protein